MQDGSTICISGVGFTEVVSQFGRRGPEGRVEGAEAVRAQREGLWGGLTMSAKAPWSGCMRAPVCMHAHVCACAHVWVQEGE